MEKTREILTITKHKEKLLRNRIHEVGKLIEDDNLIANKTAMQGFAEIICGEFPLDFLTALDSISTLEFLKQRFKFLEQSYIEEVSVSVSTYSNRPAASSSSAVILEFVLQNRPFIVDSLTEYLHYKNYELSLNLYPVISIHSSDQGQISAIKGIKEDSTVNYTFCCCIIENFNLDNQELLTNDVTDLLQMVCHVTGDFGKLSKAVDEYSLKEQKDSSENPSESERRRLFTWFNDGNVILLGAGSLAPEDITPDLSWEKIQNPLGYVRRKKELKDEQLPKEIGRLGSYFLESGLGINIIALPVFSEVHRRDRIRLVFRKKNDDETNTKVGFFHLLFTNKARKKEALAIPLARLKVNSILEKYANGAEGEEKQGYLYKIAHDFFSIIPKSELFRLDRDELRALFEQFLYFGDYQQTKMSTFSQPERRYARITFCLPNHRFSPDVFDHIDQILVEKLEYSSEIKYWFHLGRNAYSHHIFFFPHGHPQLSNIDAEALEQEVASLTMGWEEEFQIKLRNLPPEKKQQLSFKYSNVFSALYQAVFTPDDALTDIQFLETLLTENREQVDLRISQNQEDSIIYIFSQQKYQLTEIMPHLQNLSLTVIDENTYELHIGSHNVYMYTYYVKSLEDQQKKFENFHPDFCDLLLAVLENRTEDDILNGLLLSAGLNRNEVNLFILYRNYYWQIGAPYLPLNKSFLENSEVMVALRDYFVSKFNPAENCQALEPQQLQAVEDKTLDAIFQVKTVSEDIIFKTVFNLVEATIRTNYFHIDELSCMAVKIESHKVQRMPFPRPLYEIYIHGPHMEGIHMRGAKIARGGIRHSDRPEDFRTEILGLMNTQMMKNVVIVPEGSKGGFITKRPVSGRKEVMMEVAKQYRIFINSLLSLTDNIVEEKVVPAKNVVRYDDDDPYLVVAADKGTATLSDIANEISDQRGFWLKDAFASGGKFGYDHKGMGITARGAWECVKLHFLELGKDIQNIEFTVIGIGDMSGDVFGNGMLLSNHIKLLGAFNHIHIFLDPDPDPETTWKERERLFNTPGSTWNDFNSNLISQGGGVFDRAAKTVQLSPEIKKMLGVSEDAVSGEELIRLLLQAEVDLLWNGGIGTYVKASTEASNQVGDAANDAVRIDADKIRAKVIGEGGNLGLTQAARIQAAVKGIKLNTDAIDNSGGVDTSDHEINLKILMDVLLKDGQIPSQEARNELLKELTDDVAQLVLEDNISQGRVLSMDSSRSKRDIKPELDLINFLTEEGIMDPKADNLSSNEELELYFSKGVGVPRPDLSLLLSFTKMYFYKKIIAAEKLSDPFLENVYYGYFPDYFRQKYDVTKFQHPLKKEIIGTVLVNKTINQAGVTLLPRVLSITDTNAVDVIIAYTVLDEAFQMGSIRKQIMEELYTENINSAYALLINMERFIRNMLIWMLIYFESKDLSFSMIHDFEKPLADIIQIYDNSMNAEERQKYQSTLQNLIALGISSELATTLSRTFMSDSLEIIVLAKRASISMTQAFTLCKGIDALFHFKMFQSRILRLETESIWAKKHKGLLLRQLQLLKQNLSDKILEQHSDVTDFDKKLQQFSRSNESALKIYETNYQRLISSETIELSGVEILFDNIANFLV